MERVVVVNIPLKLSIHSDDHVVAARCDALGLTSYGYSRAEATSKFKQLFNRCVHAYREKGKLEDVLNRVGLEWWWESDYPEGRPAYENTNDTTRAWPMKEIIDAWSDLEDAGHERALVASA